MRRVEIDYRQRTSSDANSSVAGIFSGGALFLKMLTTVFSRRPEYTG